MLNLYEYYAADAATVRSSAFTARGGAQSVSDLMLTADAQHQQSVQAVEGTIRPSLVSAMESPDTAATGVCQRALWASMWLEHWADAIETFNTGSSDPRSISKLNQVINEVMQNGRLADYLPAPMAVPANGVMTPAQTSAAESALKAELDKDWRRLDGALDDAATRVAQKLGEDPDPGDIRNAWSRGNLPEYAANVWPDLDLRSRPINGVDSSLLGLTDDEVRERILDQRTDPLTDAEIEYLNVNYPDVMADWAKNWRPEGEVMIPSGNVIPGVAGAPGYCDPDGTYINHGYVIGPDGKVYPVKVPPQSEPGTAEQPAVGNPYGALNSSEGGWQYVTNRQGDVYIGERPPTALLVVNGILGGRPQLYGPQSIAENQSELITFDPEGGTSTHEPLPEYVAPWSSPKSVPSTMVNDGPMNTAGSAQYQAYEAAQQRFANRYSTPLSLLTGGGHGLQLSNQIDANNSYAGNVTFQTNADGEGRAVIQLSQLEDPGDGSEHPRETRDYGGVDEDGNITIVGPPG